MKANLTLAFTLLLLAFTGIPHRDVKGVVTNAANQPLYGVTIQTPDGAITTSSDQDGKYAIHVPAGTRYLLFSLPEYQPRREAVAQDTLALHVILKKSPALLYDRLASAPAKPERAVTISTPIQNSPLYGRTFQNTERYQAVQESNFRLSTAEPLSTFSIDVDRASYSNVRRFLNLGKLPPEDAVRVEEMINYFEYDYPQPAGPHPISVHTELTESPWNKGLQLLHVGIRAKSIETDHLPASNLVFLIDVSGSMSDENKLPLVKQAFALLTNQLRAQDKVSIVVYAGAAGTVLPPTSGNEKMKIREALNQLEAGGSTAGEEGISLAYDLAEKHFVKNGNNRVILATDGDFNVGAMSESELQRLIERKRQDGIFLSVLGFGMNNYKDSMMEILADKGNGNYAYIDNMQEARKQLVGEFGGTLFTVAKDVKIQIEFNPHFVQAYRLIGYENRALQNEDFQNDQKDAGEMGSGHTVTAIYEIVPAGVQSSYIKPGTALRYQGGQAVANARDEFMHVKVRYKKPDDSKSMLLEVPVKTKPKAFAECSADVRFAASVAEFGLLLRHSEFRGSASYQDAAAHAQSALGNDKEGYRSELVRLIRIAEGLDHGTQAARRD
ncbi:vWA domain-containing protein [Dyadobacter sandarakinus]|uniref:von Willebrand factor type A domain-containing protein n=1 Tax=Dyadobacter sandarakinus TaxID=2747268 RepID=A0ABX7I1B7_9BACT|nr:VWA domain-containing protein [Dyadobacter sandarakinus]QRQ99559.1 von Willebrand factor type A domain-containing protein [Dyadobacter sandarakinus]